MSFIIGVSLIQPENKQKIYVFFKYAILCYRNISHTWMTTVATKKQVKNLKNQKIIKRYIVVEDRLAGLAISMSDSDHEDAGLIPGTPTNFKCRLGLERGPPSLVRAIG